MVLTDSFTDPKHPTQILTVKFPEFVLQKVPYNFTEPWVFLVTGNFDIISQTRVQKAFTLFL